MIKEKPGDPTNEWQLERVGFAPDILVQVVGTSFEGRQDLLRLAHCFCGPDSSPPCYLERQPENPYDENAVSVVAGVDYSEDKGWSLKSVGFLPKGYSIPYRDSNNKKMKAPDGSRLVTPVWKLLDDGVGKVNCGVDGIYEQSGNYGMRLGLRHVVRTAADARTGQLFTSNRSFLTPDDELVERGSFFVFLGLNEDNLPMLRGEVKGEEDEQHLAQFCVSNHYLEYCLDPVEDDIADMILADKPELDIDGA